MARASRAAWTPVGRVPGPRFPEAVVRNTRRGERSRIEGQPRASAHEPSLTAFAGTSDGERPFATFDRITSTVTSARQIQLGARVVF